MPMELYSSEAFVRDIVNAISRAEGKPINIGGKHSEAVDRAYVFQLISEAKRALEGHAVGEQQGVQPQDDEQEVQKKRAIRGKPKGV